MAWKVPMSPAQAKNRGFYHGPSDEPPVTTDLLWKKHIQTHQKIMAQQAARSPAAATSAACPWGIQYDATMEVWSPFSNRAEIHHLRPRTALLEFRKVLASNPTSSAAWEAEHGRRNVFSVLERHSQDLPLYTPGAVEREVEWADNLAGEEGLEKMRKWAEDRAQQRRMLREEGFERVGTGWSGSGTHVTTRRASEDLLAFERMPGTSAASAAKSAWQLADRKVDRTETSKNKYTGKGRHRDSVQGPYELLLGKQAAYQSSWADHGAATIGKSSAYHVTNKDDLNPRTRTATSPSEVESMSALLAKRKQSFISKPNMKQPFKTLMEAHHGERHRPERYAGAALTDQRGNAATADAPPVAAPPNASALSFTLSEEPSLEQSFMKASLSKSHHTPGSRPRPHIHFVGPVDHTGRPVVMVKKAKAISVPDVPETQSQVLTIPSRGSTPPVTYLSRAPSRVELQMPRRFGGGGGEMPEWAMKMQQEIEELRREQRVASPYRPTASLCTGRY